MVNQAKANFSKELDELRNIALTVTRDRMIKVKFDAKAPTCSFNYETNTITLTTNAYPEYVKQNERICRKILDSSCMHESLHKTLSFPLVPYVERWIEQLQAMRSGLPLLAREIVNIVEDKKINYYGKNRYRFDLGRRQELKELIFKDQIEENLAKELAKLPKDESRINGLFVGGLLDNGLYGVDITKIRCEMNEEQNRDLDECLKILNSVVYMRLRIDVINAEKKIYEICRKHIKTDKGFSCLMVADDGGSLKGNLSLKLQQALAKMIKKEEEAEKELEQDLKKGEQAGEGSYSFDSLVYVKINGKLWYGTVGDLEKTLKEIDKLEVLTVKSYRDKTNWKSWKNKTRFYHKIIWREAKLINHGKGYVYEVALKSGRKVKVTANHNFFTEKWEHSDLQMIRTDQLKIGDSVAIPSVLPIETEDYSFGYSHIDDGYLYFIGLWFADGNYGSRCVEINLNMETDKNVIERLEQFANKNNIPFGTKQSKRGNCRGITLRFYSVGFMGKLYALGCDYPKQIPNWIFLCSNRQIKAFLEGYADGDGYKSPEGRQEISCVNREILEGLQTLYLRLGIFTHLSFKPKSEKNRKGRGTYDLETTRRKYPEITFRQVKSIVPFGYETIYDFSVPETENFIANNILLHNTGVEIPSPEPDFAKYEELVSEVKPEIDRLLSKLKQILKPHTEQDIYQRQGRIMSNILARGYTQSMRRAVSNIYVKNTFKLEKEKISLGMLIDYSGSVDKETALKITTVLTEVFGNFVEDYGFAIGCFAEDCQKVKTFFEEFQNTRARIPNISVNPCGTRIHDILESFLKMFNSIHQERRKILVIASDFVVSDQDEAEKVIEQYAKAGIELIFMGFDNCANVKTFAKKVKARRSMIAQVEDLPERFLECYIDVQK